MRVLAASHERVDLNVGGQKFSTTRTTLCKYPGSWAELSATHHAPILVKAIQRMPQQEKAVFGIDVQEFIGRSARNKSKQIKGHDCIFLGMYYLRKYVCFFS